MKGQMVSFIVNLIAILITWAPVACGGLFHHHCNSSNSWGLDRASQSAAYKCFFGYPLPPTHRKCASTIHLIFIYWYANPRNS